MGSDGQAKFLAWARDTRPPSPPPPPLSCDCQFHIFADPEVYPPKQGALYDPPNATFQDMRGVMRKLGFARGVIVHAMPYDTDHRLLIDTLSGMHKGDDIRAVAIIKDSVSDTELDKLNDLGVRGARFNIGRYYNESQSPAAVLRSMARARELGWHARLHVAGSHGAQSEEWQVHREGEASAKKCEYQAIHAKKEYVQCEAQAEAC